MHDLLEAALAAACSGASGALCGALAQPLLVPPQPCHCLCEVSQGENQLHVNVTLALCGGSFLFALGACLGLCAGSRTSVRHHISSPAVPALTATSSQVRGKGVWGSING